MIRSELANAQIASGNYGIQINGEWVFFTDHKITRIDAGEFSFEYTLQGRKQFRHNGRVISRDCVIKFFENKETAKAQEKSFREFFINPDAPHHGFFQVQINPTFADGCEHNYSRYFEYYNDAINFINNAIEFCGDVPTHITIKRDKQAGKVYYHRMPDGSVHLDKPDADFFKNYSAAEIQARIFDIDRAIKENGDFVHNCIKKQKGDVTTDCNISRANTLLAVSKNFYEFILHEHAPATDDELDGTEEDDFTDELPALFPAEDNEDDELIDPPIITPADDFEAKLAKLKAKQTVTKIVLDEKDAVLRKAQEEYVKADEAWCKTNYAIGRLLREKSDELLTKLNALPISDIRIKTTKGEEFIAQQNFGSISTLYGNFTIITQCQNRYYRCGCYKTPAQVETVIERLKATIERGDREFTFPTIEELAQSEICRKAMTELWKEEAA